MEDFVNFEVTKKLKEKGFSCKYPFAMYDEDGDFYPLFTSCDEDEDSKCIFGNRMYYDYDDFLKDKDARIAPTISQVLKWLREEKGLHICFSLGEFSDWEYEICEIDGNVFCEAVGDFHSYELASLAGIEYVLDNLI
jgi:hypothetical protein